MKDNNITQKDWSELLREKAGRVAGDAPGVSFAELREKMLAAEKASAPARRSFGWLKYAAAVAVVAAAGVLLLTNRDAAPEDSTDNIAAEVTTVATPETVAQDSPAVAEVAEAPATKDGGKKVPATTAPATKAPVTIPETADALAEASNTSDTNDNTPKTEASTGSANDNAGTNTANTNYTKQNNNQLPASADPFAEPVKPLRKQLGKFSISASGLLAANGASKESGNTNNGLLTYTDSKGNVFYSMGAPEVKYHYSAPISAGLSLRYDITDLLFAETGLRFTYLHTWITPSGAEQNLLYAGIPLGVGLNFVNAYNIRLYGSVYGMGAKCIVGRESVNFPGNYAKLGDIPILWSTGAALGLSYDITRHIGLFAEPTLSYYFPNDNAPRTLYKENPFYFTINLGVRFNFK